MLQFMTEIWPFSLWGKQKKVVLPKPEPIVPVFELPEAISDGEFTYNPDFYATEETAKQLLRRFNAFVMFKKPVQDVDRMAPAQWTLRFDDGAELNAGQMARFFAVYPEEKFSGVAFRFVLSYIQMIREERLHGQN